MANAGASDLAAPRTIAFEPWKKLKRYLFYIIMHILICIVHYIYMIIYICNIIYVILYIHYTYYIYISRNIIHTYYISIIHYIYIYLKEPSNFSYLTTSDRWLPRYPTA